MRNALLVLAAAVSLATAACSAPATDDASSDSTSDATSDLAANGVSGNFTSSECEPVGDGTFQIRHYSFSAAGGEVHWERFSNAVCSDDSKLMTILMEASAKVTGLSLHVIGAADITVTVNRKTITPTEAGLPYLQQGSCGDYPWQADTETEFTTGCGALLQQTDDCTSEYDLMKLTFHGLVFGDRSTPICSADTRPTTLSSFAVVLDPRGYVGPATSDTDSDDSDPQQ